MLFEPSLAPALSLNNLRICKPVEHLCCLPACCLPARCLPAYLYAYLPVHACMPTCLLPCKFALPTYLPAACLPSACVPACLPPACLPTNLTACPPFFSPLPLPCSYSFSFFLSARSSLAFSLSPSPFFSPLFLPSFRPFYLSGFPLSCFPSSFAISFSRSCVLIFHYSIPKFLSFFPFSLPHSASFLIFLSSLSVAFSLPLLCHFLPHPLLSFKDILGVWAESFA